MPPPVAPPYAGGLAPYAPTASDPWDARRARHLLRRSGYYASPAAIASALGRTPGAVVTAIVDAAVAATLPPVPTHATLFPPPTGATAAEIATYNTANGNGFVAEANANSKLFCWTKDPDKINAAVRRGHQALDSLH